MNNTKLTIIIEYQGVEDESYFREGEIEGSIADLESFKARAEELLGKMERNLERYANQPIIQEA